jgi:hypothetical protein
VWGWRYYEPRLASQQAPVVDVGKQDVFWGGSRIGSATIVLLNADGAWDGALGSLSWGGQDVRAKWGGVFSDGQEVLLDDYQASFSGVIKGLTSKPGAGVTLQVQDAREGMLRNLPLRRLDTYSWPMLDPQREGQPYPLLIGAATNIRPPRLALWTFAVSDARDFPNGIKALDAAYVYADATAASAKDATRRATLAAGTDYSADLTNGRVTLLRDIGPYEVAAGISDRLDFDIGGAELTATLAPGVYGGAQLAALTQAAIRVAIGGGDVTGLCTYSETTHLVTTGRSSGTFTAHLGTGANKDRSAWKLLGFNGSANLSGSSSYTGDTVLYAAPAPGVHHTLDDVFRVDASGAKDDAAGSYTGTPSALIQYPTAILRLFWRRFLLRPLSAIDVTTFAAADAAAFRPVLAAFISEQTTTRDAIQTIEQSALVDVSVDGAGILYCVAYSNADPTGAPTVLEAEQFDQSFEEVAGLADVYSGIDVLYARDPSSGAWRARSRDSSSVAVLRGRPDRRSFSTWVVTDGDAQSLVVKLATLAAAAPVRRRISTTMQIARLRPGQEFYLTRARAPLAASGTLAAAKQRIISLRTDASRGRVSAEIADHVDL